MTEINQSCDECGEPIGRQHISDGGPPVTWPMDWYHITRELDIWHHARPASTSLISGSDQ